MSNTQLCELSTTHRLSPISGAVVRPELRWLNQNKNEQKECALCRELCVVCWCTRAAPAAASERAKKEEGAERSDECGVLSVFFFLGSLEFGYRYTPPVCRENKFDRNSFYFPFKPRAARLSSYFFFCCCCCWPRRTLVCRLKVF